MSEGVDSHSSATGVEHLGYRCERNSHLYHNLMHYAVQAAFWTKHGGRCLQINDPAMKTLHVDVSCGFFLLNEVHQNKNIRYRSLLTSIPSPMEHFERSSRKTFLLVMLLRICSRGVSVVQSLSSYAGGVSAPMRLDCS